MSTIPMLVLCSLLVGQDIQHINPPGRKASPAYTEVVTAKPGTIVWVAGQTAQDAKGEAWARAT